MLDLFSSPIAVFLSVFSCYVAQFFLCSRPSKLSSPLGSPNVFCFTPFFSPFLLFVSFISVIVHVQVSLTQWICLKRKKTVLKRDFSCWSHAKHFELPLKYGRCFLNALYSFCCKIIKKEKMEKTWEPILLRVLPSLFTFHLSRIYVLTGIVYQ